MKNIIKTILLVIISGSGTALAQSPQLNVHIAPPRVESSGGELKLDVKATNISTQEIAFSVSNDDGCEQTCNVLISALGNGAVEKTRYGKLLDHSVSADNPDGSLTVSKASLSQVALKPLQSFTYTVSLNKLYELKKGAFYRAQVEWNAPDSLGGGVARSNSVRFKVGE